MSIALSTPPPAFAFSGDRIRAGFTLSGIYLVDGVHAQNLLTLPPTLTAGTTFTLSYGGKSIVLTVATTPDDSGLQIKARANTAAFSNEQQADLIRANYTLQNDFVIAGASTGVQLIGKKTGSTFNVSGMTTVAGVSESIKPNLQVKFILYCEDATGIHWENIYETELTVLIGDEVTAEAVLNDKLHNYMMAEIRRNMPDIPGTDPLLCKKSCRRYYFEFAEMYGDPVGVRRLYKSDQFTVLHGCMSTLGEATKTLADVLSPVSGLVPFLKQGGNLSTIRNNQNQYLYYFNAGASIDLVLRCRLRFTDNTNERINLDSLSADAMRKYGFNVSYNQVFDPEDYPGKTLMAYDIWLQNTAGDPVSLTQTYIVDYRYLQYLRFFQHWSSWGTMDSTLFYGKGSHQLNIAQEIADKAVQETNISKGQSLVFNIETQTTFAVTTGFMSSRRQLLMNRDFFSSVLKYRDLDGILLPLKVTTKTIDELQDGNNLLAQKFEYQYLFSDHAYTEGDIQDPGLSYDDLLPPYTFLTDNEGAFLLTIDNKFLTLT